jgi:hypothetical protein
MRTGDGSTSPLDLKSRPPAEHPGSAWRCVVGSSVTMAKRSSRANRPAQRRRSSPPSRITPSRETPLQHEHSWRWLAVVPGVLAVIVYLGVLHNPFVYDDWATIIDDRAIRSIDWHLLTASRRPVVYLSYALNYAFSTLEPLSYHITGVFIHVVNVLLLFRLTGVAYHDAEVRAGRVVSPAAIRSAQFLSAALFGVHPVLTEAVGYTSARSGLLCTTFILMSVLAMHTAATPGRGRWVAAALGFYALGLGTKETAAMLPFIYASYDYWVLPSSPEARRQRLWRLHAPLLGLTSLAAALRFYSYMRYEGGFARPAWQQLLTQITCFWRYVGLFVAPVSQSVVHSVTPVTNPFDATAWLAVGAMAAACVFAFRVRRKAPLVTFGTAWFLLLWLPSSLVSLLEHMAEHRVYEASVGFFLVCGVAGARLQQAGSARGLPTLAFATGAGLLLAVLGATTVARNQIWNDPVTLWEDAVRKAPDVWAPHYALGDELRGRGDCPRAVIEYRAAIDIRPSEPRAYENLGICLASLHRFDEAQQAFGGALAIQPNSAVAHNNLGVLAFSQGRVEEARSRFYEALALDPDNISGRQHLVTLMGQTRDRPDEMARLCADLRRLAPEKPLPSGCNPASDGLGNDGRASGRGVE